MRKRAFTLIEAMTVCAILGMIAMLAYPNFVAMKAGRDRQETYAAILRLAQQGRESSIQDGRTYTLSVTGGNTVTLQREVKEDASTSDPRQVSLGTQASLEDVASVPLAEGMTIGDVTLDNKSSSASDFILHFYPDGRSEGGGLEVVDQSAKHSLSIDVSGLATLQEGNLPQLSESRWEAGQYEQRVAG